MEQKENLLSFHLSHFPKKIRPLSPFISKLRFLLSEGTKYGSAIRWSEDGRAVVITSIDAFRSQVLETEEEMFKTRNFASFVRQLNLYGFRKIPGNGKADPTLNMQFEHIQFQRDRPDLMHLVHRTCLPNKKRSPNHSINYMRVAHGRTETAIFSTLRSSQTNKSSSPQQRKPLATIYFNQQLPKNCSDRKERRDISSSFRDGFNETACVGADSTLLGCTISREDGSQSEREHNYAFPALHDERYFEMDEEATYNFLNRNFQAEKEVVQTLIEMGTTTPRHDSIGSSFQRLSTLAEVSSKLSIIEMSGQNIL